MKRYIFLFAGLAVFSFQDVSCQTKEPIKSVSAETSPFNSATFSGMKFRNVGPAVTSGRILDIAVNPLNHSEYYLATAGGGVWKTTNAGITFTPLFDKEGSFSIGCISIDPSNPNIVWVGSGENNNQRSVSYGDGIYKSEDGGKSFHNMGLKNSEHIGMISIDPRNSNTIYVAAYGPLWSAGGDRGIYKTTDAGKTWKQILSVSENTGCNEIHQDPRNPDILYACAHQRRRHEWTYISGGPESSLYKSTDAGTTWTKSVSGFPAEDLGRIGLALSPVNPDYLYAIVETAGDKGGVFLSTDRGASWERKNPMYTAGNYYSEIQADPVNLNRIYVLNTINQVSNDGGKTFSALGEKDKHVDNHALWVDPSDTRHYLAGCDGGLYESYDAAQNWSFKGNLPITQFYKVALDNALPFYNIYGGTQDNNSLGGPSRTVSATGIINADWFVTTGGDGFESQADPEDPSVVYAQSQYGGLVRYDRKSGEAIDIKPLEIAGEEPFRWNWDAPLQVSSHVHTRLYFAANKLFRSNDRGDNWTEISPDLTRHIDRNRLPVMGKVWSIDAVAKNQSTSIYGNVISFSESPIKQDLLFVGTDDGLIQVTSDGGKNWVRSDKFSGVPEQSFVGFLLASQHKENVVYAAFNNHRNGDFKPYLFKSADGGKTWLSITSNLPEKGSVYSIAEDYINPELLFAGTEFGLFFSIDGGKKWIQLKGGLPTVPIRDIAIQKRESDLVLASFGRGFFVLDDYSALRTATPELLNQTASIFPIKDALMFIPSTPYGHRGKSFQGASFFNSENPPVGAVFTYYLKDNLKSLKEKRQEIEKEKIKKGEPVEYPSSDAIHAEDTEEAPYLLFTISDEKGNVIRRIKTGGSKGISRVTWNFRYPTPSPATYPEPDLTNPYSEPDEGPLVLPGKYQVSLTRFEEGKLTELVAAQPFQTQGLNFASLASQDKKAVLAFNQKVAELKRAFDGATSYLEEMQNRVSKIKKAILNTPSAKMELLADVRKIELDLKKLDIRANGDKSLSKREFPVPTSLNFRIDNIVSSAWYASCDPTGTCTQSFSIASGDFRGFLDDLKAQDARLEKIEAQLELNRAPYTPGRFPEWKAE
jgi:photosystem II stability/assembly factor-like uncharacterized protein